MTAKRAARLYRLLTLTADAARTGKALLAKLQGDLRGFYRDLEVLQTLGICTGPDGDRYRLAGPLDDALSHLPFPDPG